MHVGARLSLDDELRELVAHSARHVIAEHGYAF
jgi:hypothetical protein